VAETASGGTEADNSISSGVAVAGAVPAVTGDGTSAEWFIELEIVEMNRARIEKVKLQKVARPRPAASTPERF
jgi:hypothetical protein